MFERRNQSPLARVANLFGVKRQLVKRRKLAGNMAISLDCFCESTCRMKELKLDAAIQEYENNRKLELEMFN